MSYHHCRVQSIEDEKRLLEKMLYLESKVRLARENDRYLKATQSSHYTKMFQPITNSLKQLQTAKPEIKVNASTSTDHLEDMDNPDKNDELDGEKDIKDDPGDLYQAASASIPTRSRDDGIFGLNDETKRIGDYSFFVDGNTLYIMDHGELVKSFVIDDYELWQLLLIKRPKDIGLELKDIQGRNTQTLEDFIHIVQDLDLVSVAKKGSGSNKESSQI